MSEAIIFGTDGWRAIIAEDFTFANVERAVYAMGLYIKETYHSNKETLDVPVLIGYDTRFLADKFAVHAAQLLMDMGIKAKVSKRDVPTPCIAWATQHEPTAGALQFTASHNPPEYCGLKYIPHFAGPATNDITNSIVKHLRDMPVGYKVPNLPVEYFDPSELYMSSLAHRVDLKKIGASNLKIGFDALYSTSRGYLDKILRDCGSNPTVLHDYRDPLFGGGMPEPKPEYLKDLMALVKKDKLDVGLATDGDADRFSVVDENGNFFTPNQLLCLLTKHLVKNRKQTGAIVRTVATTHLLDRIAKLYDLKVIETPVGFKYIGEIMRTGDVLIGGEESGGVSVKGHIPEKDGILANLLLVEMMAYEQKPLTEIWADLLKEAGVTLTYRRADLKLTDRTAKGLMQRLLESPMTNLAGKQVTKESRLDGLKLYIDHENWLLIRPSGTEPLIRLYFEGTSPEHVQKVMEDFQAQVDAILEDLEKQFVRSSAEKPALSPLHSR
jgi:phosphomannomutase